MKQKLQSKETMGDQSWIDGFNKTLLITKAGSWLECSEYEATVIEIKDFIYQLIIKEK